MSTTPTPPSLPIIDISAFVHPDPDPNIAADRKRATAHRVHEACRDAGFFYLTGHGIETEVMEKVLRLAKEFFLRPDEEKAELSISRNDQARGYQRLGENVTRYKKDFHEVPPFIPGLDLYKPVTAEHYVVRNNLPLRGENLWPKNPPEFRAEFEDYVERMKRLGQAVMGAMAMGLGMEESYFERFLDDSFWCVGGFYKGGRSGSGPFGPI
ncbi:hypothetical protein BC938DRAFT_480776 [Jimgerdemannia flammicorona]|uniref:Non-haem dioxygenase N-terminal domain-containing protein n=1 Tax=Jimgerdemannia flammicorona TaxID=994334 RepID=A0A433QHQ1_9FUNG|nr:hypothetical protein BC938DRAFT_480776 [Jimgerdemannia flammicorona]